MELWTICMFGGNTTLTFYCNISTLTFSAWAAVFVFRNFTMTTRVQKMLNSSYEPNQEISNLTTFSETRQPDFDAKSIYFAI